MGNDWFDKNRCMETGSFNIRSGAWVDGHTETLSIPNTIHNLRKE
jgi:hypothetical protein